jgi:hypothetical protein
LTGDARAGGNFDFQKHFENSLNAPRADDFSDRPTTAALASSRRIITVVNLKRN